jgi:general secretion pathway protein D
VSSDTETKSVSGIPGLINVPLLKFLAGNQTKDHEQDSILIALVPHIIRVPGRFKATDGEVLGGTALKRQVGRVAPSRTSQTVNVSPDQAKLSDESAERLPSTGNPKIDVGK